MRLSCDKQKPTIQMRLFFTFATFLITTSLYSQVKPYFAIGAVNEYHDYSGNTGYLQWNGLPILETNKTNVIGTSINLGTVLFDKFIIGYTHSKSNTNGNIGLNHFKSITTTSGISLIPIIARTKKLNLGIGLNASNHKSSVEYSDENYSYRGGSWGNLISLAIPIWIDFKVSDKVSILCLPSYGIRESFYFTVLPVWNMNIGMVYDLNSENTNSTSKKIKTY
jgi:hypothetical protein